MRTEEVHFFSEGDRIQGVLKTPSVGEGPPWPILVHGPGWLETVGHPLSTAFHEGLVKGGYAVLQFDYRGFGESEGPRGWLRPYDQQIDIRNAITYVTSRSDLDAERLGLFALGGTGGGNATYVASREPLVKAICAQTVVADGVDWLSDQRREYEWIEFKQRVARNRISRVLHNHSELVDPTEEIMIATPERKKKGMPTRGNEFELASVDYLSDFRPVDVMGRVSPCAVLLTCVEDDVVTPAYHARALYEAARPPRRLIIQRGVNHYEAYSKNYDFLIGQFLEWYGRYLRPGPRDISPAALDDEVVEYTRSSQREAEPE